MALKKIVVIGPESTGKSTLCQALASHFNTVWVEEYAREYLETNGIAYQYNDLSEIAAGQLNLENKYFARLKNDQNVIMIDTNLYVIKIWSEYVYGTCEPWILETIAQRTYDLYLLCKTDIPWEFDPLREYPDLAAREKLYHIYKDHMVNQHVPWVEIGGSYEERFERAKAAIVELLQGKVN
ncbi:MAG TPA: ATP-binding protein [Parasegetibacter sp.]